MATAPAAAMRACAHASEEAAHASPSSPPATPARAHVPCVARQWLRGNVAPQCDGAALYLARTSLPTERAHLFPLSTHTSFH
eukprot:109726-Chlamydomonas_euryale.AAC.5